MKLISTQSNPWKVKASVNDVATKFKLDTRVDVSVIPDTVFRKLKSQLSGTKRTLTDQIKSEETAWT